MPEFYFEIVMSETKYRFPSQLYLQQMSLSIGTLGSVQGFIHISLYLYLNKMKITRLLCVSLAASAYYYNSACFLYETVSGLDQQLSHGGLAQLLIPAVISCPSLLGKNIRSHS